VRRATRRQLHLFVRVLLAGTLVGLAYGALTELIFGTPRAAFYLGLVGAIDGAAITAPISALELYLLRSRLGRRLQQAPFLVTLGVKWVVYAVVITTVIAGGPGARIAGLTRSANAFASPRTRLAFLFSVVVTFVFVFVLEIREIVGPRNLRNIVLGRYHRPRAEERFFLFIDVAGSTSLAERVGPVAVHRFLNGVFRCAADPIADYAGEIYQYVGDEMVVTWTAAEARPEARPLACFFAIEAALAEAAAEFEGEFGVTPRLRAALHAGTVISGEIGETKRDIVFHGDVMNTTARLEQATRELDRRFLASGDALSRLTATERYALERLGPRALRGRTTPVEVYAVESKGR
jgi:adenylate cyclase